MNLFLAIAKCKVSLRPYYGIMVSSFVFFFNKDYMYLIYFFTFQLTSNQTYKGKWIEKHIFKYT